MKSRFFSLSLLYLIILVFLVRGSIQVFSDIDSTGLEFPYQDKFIQDSKGRLHIVFEDSGEDIQHATSADNGSTWSSTEILTGTSYIHPSLAVDSNNGLHVVLVDGGPNNIIYINSSNQSTWSTPTIIASTSNLDEPSIAIGPSNELRVCYIDLTQGDLMYIGSDNLGLNWSGAEVNTSAQDRCDIEVDSTGMIHIVAQSDGPDTIYHYNSSNGINWSTTLIDDGTNHRNPTIAIGNNDQIYVAWGENVASSKIWFANSSDKGKSWTTRSIQVNTTSTLNDALYANIVVDASNNLHIFYDLDNNTADYVVGYINSTNEGFSFSSPIILEVARTNPSSENAQLVNVRGSKYPVSNRVSSTLDYIWADTFGTDQVRYNKINLTSPLIADTTPPKIDFGVGTESNNSNFSRDFVFVNVSVTEVNPANITFILYNTTSLVNTTVYSLGDLSSNLSINFTSLAYGYYFYNVSVTDTANNRNQTVTRGINLTNVSLTLGDTTPPVVTINSPSSTNISLSSVTFNVTLNENGTCLFTLDSGINNITMQNNANRNFNYTNSSIADGPYSVRFYCNDTSGNINSTATRGFGIDTTPPTITITSPLNQTYTTSSILFNITLGETGGYARLTLNSGVTNYSMSNLTLAIFNYTNSSIADGSYTVRFYANDSAGNLNSTVTRTFSINTVIPDTTPPLVAIINPQNITYNTQSINFNFSINENGTCVYSLNNGILNYSMAANSSNTGFGSTNNSIADGSYSVWAYCNDTAGNINNSVGVVFSKDASAPQVDFGVGTQDDYANTSGNFIYVNVSVVELNFANITFTLKNDSSIVNITTYSSPVFFVNFTNLAFGNYTYNVSVYDSLLNFNTTLDRRINLSDVPASQNVSGSSGGGLGGGGGLSIPTPVNTSQNSLVLIQPPIEIPIISINQSNKQDILDLEPIYPYIQELFTQARQDILEMRRLEIPVSNVNRLFEEAYDAFLKGDYSLAESKIAEIRGIKQRALIARDKLSGIRKNPVNFLTGAVTTAYNNEDFDFVIKNADISNTSSIMLFFSNLILVLILITFVSRIFVSHYVYSLPTMINKKRKLKQKIFFIRKENKLKINKLNKNIVFLGKKIRKEAKRKLIKIERDRKKFEDKIKVYDRKERGTIRRIDFMFKKKEHPYVEHLRSLKKKKSYLNKFIRR